MEKVHGNSLKSSKWNPSKRTQFKSKDFAKKNPKTYLQRGNHLHGGKRVWNVHNGKTYCIEDDPILGSVNGRDGRFNECIRAEKKGLVIISEAQMVGKAIQTLPTEVLRSVSDVVLGEVFGRPLS